MGVAAAAARSRTTRLANGVLKTGFTFWVVTYSSYRRCPCLHLQMYWDLQISSGGPHSLHSPLVAGGDTEFFAPRAPSTMYSSQIKHCLLNRSTARSHIEGGLVFNVLEVLEVLGLRHDCFCFVCVCVCPILRVLSSLSASLSSLSSSLPSSSLLFACDRLYGVTHHAILARTPMLDTAAYYSLIRDNTRRRNASTSSDDATLSAVMPPPGLLFHIGSLPSLAPRQHPQAARAGARRL
jgi:hypothetical protein